MLITTADVIPETHRIIEPLGILTFQMVYPLNRQNAVQRAFQGANFTFNDLLPELTKWAEKGPGNAVYGVRLATSVIAYQDGPLMCITVTGTRAVVEEREVA